MEKRLEISDWLRAARKALLRGGPDAVRVEPLAKQLNVTKGSFYWHFKNRQELLEALLREWEEETATLVADLPSNHNPAETLAMLFARVSATVVTSECGESPSDAAIFSWAAISPAVRVRANREERRRIALLTDIVGDADRAEYIYLAYLGFILRRRRVRDAARTFPTLAKLSIALAAAPPAGEPLRRRTNAKPAGRAPRH